MLNATPITGTLGATITGVDLSSGDNRLVADIKAALTQFKVLVLPDQAGLAASTLLTFAERFGVAERAEHPTWDDVPDAVGVKLIHARNDSTGPSVANSWHTDGATRQSPWWLSFLYGHQVPDYGRDTMFADMEAAYQRLSPAMQEFLQGRTALHSWGRQKPDAAPVEHPVILDNPDTGRKTLYLNYGYTRSIVGLSAEESDAMLAMLLRHTHVPELQLRVSWNPGTLTIFDNARLQHALVRDRASERVLHRVMVETTGTLS